jgi:glycine dehydrogenase subunit 2
VLAEQLHGERLLAIRGVTKSHPHLTAPRLEMTRYSLGAGRAGHGITVVDVQNRMVDFGIDAFWLSHEPWLVPRRSHPEAGEMWSKEDVDEWIDVLAHVSRRRTPTRSSCARAAQPGDPQARRDATSTIPAPGRRPGGRNRRKHAAAGERADRRDLTVD